MRHSLLRFPVFPGAAPHVASASPGAGGRASGAGTIAPDAIEPLFAAIRAARVGGAFWAPPGVLGSATRIVRARTIDDLDGAGSAGADDTLWLLPARLARRGDVRRRLGAARIGADAVDPWSLLDGRAELVAHGDDEWVAIAVIAGCPVRLLSAGRFGTPGDDRAALAARVARDLEEASDPDPFTGEAVDPAALVAWLGDLRRSFAANQGIVAACGFSWWKRAEIARFLSTPRHALRFFWSERRAIAYAARVGGAIAVWPSRVSAGLAAAAAARGVALVRVEDGFVRSVGLGSNLVPPSSITIDRLGIHYDPTRPSDLERLLAEGVFADDLLVRAERLRATILSAGISKYGGDAVHVFPERVAGKRLVLVAGQVEDDQSVLLGGGGLTSNLEVLRRARLLEPDAEIWFRPHPDVDAGHRRGVVRDADALQHADRIVRGGTMARLLDLVDAVHVLTSLTGFEALLRGRAVTCHGVPFYAGWGLTRDLMAVPERRHRRLALAELVAAVLIVYPRYLDPLTGLPCPPEVLIARMAAGNARNRLAWVTKLKQVQGRMTMGWS
ncbi:beta-3-deoxy-D-manno-oct-2-ulosonic acid transferase [Sphingomonas sp. RB3P16]|uniref:capsular polysaccharide export protein, LipB/KpsS family n=1 Tax=Parasphingomonas frigoris TaxID=3096163 RepID=UPI002FC8DBB7